MKGGAVAIFGAAAVLSTASALSECELVCTRNLRPVCGSDGKTYANECVLHAEACKANMLVVVTLESACPGDPQFAPVDTPTITPSPSLNLLTPPAVVAPQLPPLTSPLPARPINPNRPAFVFSPNLPASQQGQMVGGPAQTSSNGIAELRGPVQPVAVASVPQQPAARAQAAQVIARPVVANVASEIAVTTDDLSTGSSTVQDTKTHPEIAALEPTYLRCYYPSHCTKISPKVQWSCVDLTRYGRTGCTISKTWVLTCTNNQASILRPSTPSMGYCRPTLLTQQE